MRPTDPLPAPARERAAGFAAEHGQSLLRLAWLLTRGDEATSQDLVQSTLTKMLAHGFERIEHPAAFARRAMLNEVRDASRRRSVQRRALPVLETEAGLRAQVAPGAGSSGGGVEDRTVLHAALGTLGRREQIVVVLRYYEDLPDAEIADLLGCGTSTVRSLARRALIKLRDRLDADDERPARTDPQETS